MSVRPWTPTLADVKSGQLDLLRTSKGPRIAVLELRGTRSTVSAARTTQWSAYGLSVVLDELNANVSRCTPDTMSDYDVALYSVTSPVDILSMAEELPGRDAPGRRRCSLVVGGQGAYPVWALRDLVDRVHFGRAEGAARQACLETAKTECQYEPANDYDICDKYLIRGNTELQPMEESVGCRLGCAFCQYTFTREISGQKRSLSYNAGKQGHVVAEDTFASVDLSTPGRKTTALDGWSEDTRKRVRKGITDDYIARRLRAITESVEGIITLKVFQIVGYPWESAESIQRDISHMSEVLHAADARHKLPGRVLLMFLCTPFSPEPLTPMEDEPANVHTDWRRSILGDTGRSRPVYKGINIEAFILPQIQRPITLLKRVAVNRGATAEQLRNLNRCKTVEEMRLVVGNIWEAGAGRRVSDYLSPGFKLPTNKWEQFQSKAP